MYTIEKSYTLVIYKVTYKVDLSIESCGRYLGRYLQCEEVDLYLAIFISNALKVIRLLLKHQNYDIRNMKKK